MEIKELHQLFLKSSRVCTDTRKIKKYSIFFALKGANFNGNQFASQALDKGAVYAVVDEKPAEENKNLIVVEDVLKALQQLATFHREYLKIPIIALTGSNGKTTTKELINAVLSKKYKTAATTGNLNNHIGVPLTLLSMNRETEIGIVEMGANHPKEIEFLCKIAKPDFGYITNFGKAHLEGFKSLEGVISAKSELYQFLKENNKTLFLNFDDPVQKKQQSYSKVYSFGSEKRTNIQLEFPSVPNFSEIEYKGTKIGSRLTGSYNAKNMAAAYAIGCYFEVPKKDIKDAIENYIPSNNRSQIIEKGSNKIILDAYNANPSSMAAALENFENLRENPKMAILGDMFELGAFSEKEHQQLVNKLEKSRIENIFLIGENFFRTTSSEEKIKKIKTFEAFEKTFNPVEIKYTTILIKGSRGMALERILEML